MKDYPYIQALTYIYIYFRWVISCDFCVKTHQIKNKKKNKNTLQHGILQQSINMKTSTLKFLVNRKTCITEPQNMSRDCACLFTFLLHITLGLFLSLYLHSVRHAEKGPCLFAFWTFGIFGINEGRQFALTFPQYISWHENSSPVIH